MGGSSSKTDITTTMDGSNNTIKTVNMVENSNDVTNTYSMFDFHTNGTCNYLALAFIICAATMIAWFFRYRISKSLKCLKGKPVKPVYK